jgi:hypothetical protein
MRTTALFFLGAFGCGTGVQATSDSGPTTLPSYGTITVGVADAFESNTNNGKTVSGQPDVLSASLFPLATVPTSACAGATVTDGACCYVAAATPPVPSSDGGPLYVMLDVGPITLTDVTSNASLGGIAYTQMFAGPGYADGYPGQDFGPSAWNAGDVLQIAVAGGAGVSAFTAQTHALASPTSSPASSLDRTQSFTVSWTPDANATTMTVTLSAATASSVSHGAVMCSVADASASVTITPSVLAAFASGDSVVGELTRTTSQEIAVGGGNAVTFVTSAASGFSATVK